METNQTSYEHDFYAWLNHQALLLKEERFAEIDLLNLVEEIETLGRIEYRNLKNGMEILIQYLLKFQFQPNNRNRIWHATIIEQRNRVLELLKDSPSLKSYLQNNNWVQDVWITAAEQASTETGLLKSIFPQSPIWSIDEILDDNFYPKQKTDNHLLP